ncbi:type III-A CRISPR-associated RAMP protein Csm3 [Peptacetobacter hiranonis]|uniref:type III-A CRISPR-associated RAMP protein Csm3 n=1 Tax=Peptacetobacter hiranonis TaxID=89152 RepID=UPI0022E5AA83|nr:type III-A CRISPR-associated RAMP protein Csm3 [Peptacetobacter hiranonis]
MFAKIEIKGKIILETGMHIGGSTQFSAIGAIDSPVIRDSFTDLPMIPGSSLKGKIRTLLAKKYNNGKLVEPNKDDIKVRRLFGSSEGDIKSSRLIFSDSILSNAEELKQIGVSSTEIKVENTINRITAIANPRQIERAVRGSEFDFSIIYNAEEESEIKEDLSILKEGLKFLEYDYLGGNGSRGYGRVKIDGLKMDVVVGEIDNKIKADCEKVFEG